MRIILALPLLMTAACNVENDPQNNQVTLEYNEQQIENTAADVGNTAENIGAAIGNEAERAADKIGNTDVDVDTSGNDAENTQ